MGLLRQRSICTSPVPGRKNHDQHIQRAPLQPAFINLPCNAPISIGPRQTTALIVHWSSTRSGIIVSPKSCGHRQDSVLPSGDAAVRKHPAIRGLRRAVDHRVQQSPRGGLSAASAQDGKVSAANGRFPTSRPCPDAKWQLNPVHARNFLCPAGSNLAAKVSNRAAVPVFEMGGQQPRQRQQTPLKRFDRRHLPRPRSLA